MDIAVQVSTPVSACDYWGMYLGVELLDHLIILCLIVSIFFKPSR